MRAPVLILLCTVSATAQDFGALVKATHSLRTALEADLPDDAAKALRAITRQYPFGDTRAQKGAVAAVGKAARSSDARTRHGAFRTLAALRARGSSRYLAPWLDPPAILPGPAPPSCLEAIRAAGAIADRATLPVLKKLARHDDVTIAEAAILAFGGYRRLPTPQRKRLAFGLVDQLRQMSLEPPMPRKGKPSTKKQGTKGSEKKKEARTAKERVQLAAAMVKALQGLTGQKHRALEAWTKWRERAARLRDPF
ncbi:MAG: hypothetical protein ACYTG3_13490 [Planctomycetota bacterium]|jgi:hypothetical protein